MEVFVSCLVSFVKRLLLKPQAISMLRVMPRKKFFVNPKRGEGFPYRSEEFLLVSLSRRGILACFLKGRTNGTDIFETCLIHTTLSYMRDCNLKMEIVCL